jgi:uncharacterized damage-inducible protein DinB
MPPPIDDEREQLLAYLKHQRHVLRLCAHGLTDEQARATPSASALSVGGVIKHVDKVERNWVAMIRQENRGSAAEYSDAFHVGRDETLASVVAHYDATARDTDEVVRAHDLTDRVPVPRGVPWFPADLESWTLRWVVLHLISETARHAGHADIVRESIDGATAFPLMAAAEGWPTTSWVRPWEPPSA